MLVQPILRIVTQTFKTFCTIQQKRTPTFEFIKDLVPLLVTAKLNKALQHSCGIMSKCNLAKKQQQNSKGRTNVRKRTLWISFFFVKTYFRHKTSLASTDSKNSLFNVHFKLGFWQECTDINIIDQSQIYLTSITKQSSEGQILNTFF